MSALKDKGKKTKPILSKKESNSQSKDVTGLLFKENKSKNGVNKIDMSNSNSESISEHEAKGEETQGRSD